jgi:hypothetical protein
MRRFSELATARADVVFEWSGMASVADDFCAGRYYAANTVEGHITAGSPSGGKGALATGR